MANISVTTDLVINRLSQTKYNQLCANGQLSEYQLYITDDDCAVSLSNNIQELKETKVNSTAIAPNWSSVSVSYPVSYYVTYNGNAYECISAYTTDGSSLPPSQDPGHWKITDMTSPDATLDIMANGALGVVGADGTVLWLQGYDRYNPATTLSTSFVLSNESECGFIFQEDATSAVTLMLPTPPNNKVGDFILEVQNPSLGTEFLSSDTYMKGNRVIYNSAVYTCSADTHSGAWADGDFSLKYAAYDSTLTSGYDVGTKVVHDGKLWECKTAIASGSAAGSFDPSKWSTASFSIQGLPDFIRMVVQAGENLTEILTIGAGIYTQLYFTQTSFTIDDKPTWKVNRQDCEVVA